MTRQSINMNVEQDFLVSYIITRGIWTGSKRSRKFGMASEEIPENKAIVVTATDYMKARNIAYAQLIKTKAVNEYIKIIRATPIPKKEKKEEKEVV